VSDAPLFGPLPRTGIWTAVGLRRGQFGAILALTIALFLWIDGPLWHHLRDSHFDRIVISYGIIPPLVAWALWRNGEARPMRIIEASVVVAFVKLVVTAVLMIAIALAR
jgi:hypothetical protein